MPQEMDPTQVLETTESEGLLPLEAFNQWRSHPATEAIMAALQRQVDLMAEKWIRGEFLGKTPDTTHRMMTEALCRVDAYRSLINLEYEDYKESYRD